MSAIQKQFDEISSQKKDTGISLDDSAKKLRSLGKAPAKKPRRRRLRTLAIAASLIVCAMWLQHHFSRPDGPPLATTSPFLSHFQEAAALYRRGDFDGALVILQDLEKIAPTHATLLSSYAAVEIAAGHYEAAKTHIDEALKIEPENAVHLNNLGAFYLKTKSLDQAEQALRKGIALNPALPDLYLNLGQIKEEALEPNEAIASYESFLKLMPPASQRKHFLRDRIRVLRSIVRIQMAKNLGGADVAK